jgi:diaminopimelate epimerase
MIDDRREVFPTEDRDKIAHLCHRRFGIGADGLILLRGQEGSWEMVYFNSDGRESSMCGNGGRCLVAFAHSLGLLDDHFSFKAIDGNHRAIRHEDGRIELSMKAVKGIEKNGDAFVLDTGSPHYVSFRSNIEKLDVKGLGAVIRYSDPFRAMGINVNFAEPLSKGSLFVRTYERGVEDETLSCGTGVTAVALAYMHRKEWSGNQTVSLQTPGGKLSVCAEITSGGFSDIRLSGPAQKVFEGSFSI